VKVSRQVLYDSLNIRRLFPKVPAQGLLTWSHYRRLLSVQNPALQERLLSQAVEGNWSLRELDTQIRETGAIDKGLPPGPVFGETASGWYCLRIVDSDLGYLFAFKVCG